MDKGNQKGLTSDKRCVYTFDSLSNYLLDGRVYFFQIEYHNTRRVFSSDNCCFSSNSYFSQANRRFFLFLIRKSLTIKLQNNTVLLFEQQGAKKQSGAPPHLLSVGKPLVTVQYNAPDYCLYGNCWENLLGNTVLAWELM